MLNGTNERSRERAEKDGEGEERGKKKKRRNEYRSDVPLDSITCSRHFVPATTAARTCIYITRTHETFKIEVMTE